MIVSRRYRTLASPHWRDAASASDLIREFKGKVVTSVVRVAPFVACGHLTIEELIEYSRDIKQSLYGQSLDVSSLIAESGGIIILTASDDSGLAFAYGCEFGDVFVHDAGQSFVSDFRNDRGNYLCIDTREHPDLSNDVVQRCVGKRVLYGRLLRTQRIKKYTGRPDRWGGVQLEFEHGHSIVIGFAMNNDQESVGTNFYLIDSSRLDTSIIEEVIEL